ncbi:MAG: hypothetical protein ACI9K2_002224 [Myxococcota bacterium]|jgi:hypothetical protein
MGISVDMLGSPWPSSQQRLAEAFRPSHRDNTNAAMANHIQLHRAD